VPGVIGIIVGITLHRRGPDELPSSPYFLLAMLAASMLVELTALRATTAADQTLVMTVLDQIVNFAFVFGVLAVFERSRRFKQTMSALLGADIVTNLASAPLIYWHEALHPPPNTATAPSFLLLLVAVWAIDIAGFVVSRAIERPYALGVAIMLAYVFLYYAVRNTLFPQAV
jgi:small basic protein